MSTRAGDSDTQQQQQQQNGNGNSNGEDEKPRRTRRPACEIERDMIDPHKKKHILSRRSAATSHNGQKKEREQQLEREMCRLKIEHPEIFEQVKRIKDSPQRRQTPSSSSCSVPGDGADSKRGRQEANRLSAAESRRYTKEKLLYMEWFITKCKVAVIKARRNSRE